jgi:hypothetical protein
MGASLAGWRREGAAESGLSLADLATCRVLVSTQTPLRRQRSTHDQEPADEPAMRRGQPRFRARVQAQLALKV